MSRIDDRRRKRAWDAGHQACVDGKAEEACDQPMCTIYADDWHDGWAYADHQIWQARP